MNSTEFAQLIKSKHPDYQNVEDNLLVKKVLEKYPEYRSQVDLNATEPLFSGKRVLKGIVPDVVNTAKGIGNLVYTGLPQMIGGAIGTPENILPTIKKGVVGAGEAIGQYGANLAYMPKETIKKTIIGMQEKPVTTATTALFAVPGASKLALGKTAEMMDKISTNLGRRALGYTQGVLNKGGTWNKAAAVKKANEVADVMLKENVIPKLGSTKKALENVELLAKDSGQALATIREELQTAGPALNAMDVDFAIYDKLTPMLKGGDFKAVRNTVKRIRETMLSAGTGELDFNTAQTILDQLRSKAKYGTLSTSSQQSVAKLYKKAAGILSDAIDDGVSKVAQSTNNPKLLEDYLNNKNLYSKSMDAMEVLAKKHNAELGNNAIGLRAAGLGMAELGAGNPLGAVVAVGGAEAIKRRGLGIGANLAKDAANKSRQIGNLGVSKDFLKYKGAGVPLGNTKGNVLLGKGEDKIVYHGTDVKGLKEFDDMFLGKNKAEPAKLGHWFTDDIQYAKGHGSNIVEAKLGLENPKVYTREQWGGIEKSKDFGELRKELESQGYDGIRVLSSKEKLGRFDVRNPEIYSVFNPKKINVLNKGSQLESEALKYKTPEEFVKAQTKGYNEIDINKFVESAKFKTPKGVQATYTYFNVPPNEQHINGFQMRIHKGGRGMYHVEKIGLDENLYPTESISRKSAVGYNEAKKIVAEEYLNATKSKVNIAQTQKNVMSGLEFDPSKESFQQFIERKSNENISTIPITETDNISQLTDIWNKAHSKLVYKGGK